MSEFTLRHAHAAEFAGIGELTVAAYRDQGFLSGAESYTDTLRDAETRARDAELLVAVDESGTVLGSVTLASAGTSFAEVAREGELEFRMLAVTPEAQGRGVGEALVNAVLDRARAAGIGRVVLCSQDSMRAAHRLYQRTGFRRLPDRDWQPLPGIALLGFGLDL